MKKVNYLFVLLAIVFSFFILFISLQSANKAKMLGGEKLVGGKFYVSKEILPDHSLYSLLMFVDRLRLEMADSEKSIYLMASYADRRLFYSQRLIEKDDLGLAFTTLSKAIKYTNQSLADSIAFFEKSNLSKNSEHQRMAFFVLENFEEHKKFVIENRDKFGNEENMVLESLYSESNSLAEKLQRLINQSIQKDK